MCDKTFKSNHDLTKHIRFHHEGARDHPCDQCEYNASTASNLGQHKAAVHMVTQFLYNLAFGHTEATISPKALTDTRLVSCFRV